MAVLKMAKDSNILENNMVQTQASAAGTLSAIIFIIPGMLMIGYWQGFEFWQTLLVSACGGCLGVLFTIPLRRAMVVHSDLAYPEGVAAAEILKVGSGASGKEGASSGVKEITSGGILAGVIVVSVSNGGSEAPLAIVGKGFANTAEWLGFLVFIVFLGIFSKVVLGAGKKQG